MNKKLVITICSLAITAIAFTAVYKNFIAKPKQIILTGDYANQKSNYTDLINSAELVVVGKIKTSHSVKIHDVIFTDYELDVKDVLKSPSSSYTTPIIVRLTGGTLDGIEQISEGIKQLDKNDTYLFAIHRTFPDKQGDNIYTPVGALQGIISVEGTGDKLNVKDFNSDNNIEKQLKGKKISKSEIKKEEK